MRRVLAGMALLVAGAMALSGCTGSAGTPKTNDKTIDYWGFDGGLTTVTAKRVIAGFEASHPGYKVNPVVMDTSDFDVKLPSTLGKSSGPDLVYTGTEPNHLGRYVKVGQVAALGDVWNANGWNVQPASTQARVTYDGKKYAVGNELETVGLLYNKVILDKLGIKVPTTLAELQAAMAKVKASSGGATPMVLACGGPCYSGLHMMHGLAYSMIPTKQVLAATTNGTGAYTQGRWVDALTTFQDWNKAGYFTKDSAGVPDENHTAEFCAGNAAFMVEGPWMFNQMSECQKAAPTKLKFGFTGFPMDKGMPFQAYVGTGKAWFLSSALNSDPEKKKAVLDLVKAMTATSTYKSWVEKDQLFPAATINPADYTLSDPQKAALKIINDAGTNGGAVDVGFNNSAEETQTWVSGLQGLLEGSETPQQVVTNLQAQLAKDQKAWTAKK